MRETYDTHWVEERVEETIAAWQQCALRPWPGEPQFTRAQQKCRERAYDAGLHTVEREARLAPRNREGRLAAQRRVIQVFPHFASIALGLEDEAVALLTGSFLPAGTALARWARCFDATLGADEIIQASRNAWTACGLQALLGCPMQLTPSILGYSLLYPYSDNFLDRSNLSSEQKLHFSSRFRRRLQGEHLPAQGPHESAVWTMVQLIEEEFPRLQFPCVYESLLAIHAAQETSLQQLKSVAVLSPRELLRISFAKGGTSVLADACLVRGSLTPEESRLAFAWGALLQLGDDLQDLREDRKRGSSTLFTRALSEGQPIDALVSQLLNFSDMVAARMQQMPAGGPALKDLLRMSWRNLILMAVAGVREFCSPPMLARLEARSPFRFGFLRARQRRMAGRRGLYALLFDAFLEAGEGDLKKLPSPCGCTELGIKGWKGELVLHPAGSLPAQ